MNRAPKNNLAQILMIIYSVDIVPIISHCSRGSGEQTARLEANLAFFTSKERGCWD